MARAFFRPPALGRRPLKTGNRKWAGFPRAGKPTSQVGVFEPLKNGPIFARAEMGPFFKGWISGDFHFHGQGISHGFSRIPSGHPSPHHLLHAFTAAFCRCACGVQGVMRKPEPPGFQPLENGPIFARAKMGPFLKGWISVDSHKTQIGSK